MWFLREREKEQLVQWIVKKDIPFSEIYYLLLWNYVLRKFDESKTSEGKSWDNFEIILPLGVRFTFGTF